MEKDGRNQIFKMENLRELAFLLLDKISESFKLKVYLVCSFGSWLTGSRKKTQNKRVWESKAALFGKQSG